VILTGEQRQVIVVMVVIVSRNRSVTEVRHAVLLITEHLIRYEGGVSDANADFFSERLHLELAICVRHRLCLDLA
jgi:hypothetical protein